MYDDSFKSRYNKAPIAISRTDDFSSTSPHIHNEIEILYIVKGRSQIQISNEIIMAKAGDVLFVNPIEVHSVVVDESSSYCHKCICFDCSLIADRELANGLQKGYVQIPHSFNSNEENGSRIALLFDDMFEAVLKNSVALLFNISARVSELFEIFVENDLLIKKSADNKERRFCSEVIRYISMHYSEKITSNDVSKSLFYIQSHFCRRFKKVFGTSFSDYLNMYRLHISKEKLLNENKSIGAIANECGFENQSYFTACFKKTFKMTPFRYRKINTVINSCK